jgi:Tol biopolymer transport system component
LITDQVAHDPTTWHAAFSTSRNGVLAYQTGDSLASSKLAWFDRSGRELGTVEAGNSYADFRLRPDGRQLAMTMLGPWGGDFDIWVLDLARSVRTRLTAEAAAQVAPVWGPTGNQIVSGTSFTGSPNGPYRLERRATSGGALPEVLLETKEECWPTDWSSDGRFILFTQGDYIGMPRGDIWVLPVAPDAEPVPWLDTPFWEDHGQFSPNGAWIAYASNQSGRSEVYVEAFDSITHLSQRSIGMAKGAPVQVSTAGGMMPRWRQDGREIFFLSLDDKIMVAEMSEDEPFRCQRCVVVLTFPQMASDF